jgi:lipopolysaccharide export system protein LptC
MAARRNSYSRMVAWLKILLPLIAIGVLGTVFLFNSKDGFEAGFTFSRTDIESLEKGSFIKSPQINGITQKGEPFHMLADEIRPLEDNNSLVVITNLDVEFQFKSGAWAKVTSPSAQMDVAAETVWFESGGRLETSDGNVAVVDTLHLLMALGELQGSGIVADGPLGRVSAENFRIESDGSENRVLWFENNVRMQYDLQNESE